MGMFGAHLLKHWRLLRLATLETQAFCRAMLQEAIQQSSRPIIDGKIFVDGLHGPIEILRDSSGIPHIFASNSDDALFGLGFTHLQDRFWQMEFYRRIAAGRMAEVSGPKALSADVFMRHIGLTRSAAAAWEETPDDIRKRVQPYTEGVNAAMRQTPLPLEIRILNYTPEPWQTEDSLIWSKLVSFMLSPAWEAQVIRARVIEEVGLDALMAVDPGYPRNGTVMTPPDIPYGVLTGDLLDTYRGIAAKTGLLGTVHGSNNWAVSGTASDDGRALLACDPHLSATAPPMLYFAHLDCPEFTVAGAGLTGAPGIIWGFNRKIAWGPTAGLASIQDIFVEEFDGDTNLYRTPDGFEEAEIRSEHIAVRGHSSVPLRIRVTRHGPVISPVLPGVRHALALRSSVLDSAHSGAGLLSLFTADDPESFRQSVAEFKDYSLSFGYADDQGRVGMQVSGLVPKRMPGHGWLPSPGWDAEFDWKGFVPAAELPNDFDPVSGRVWSANNAPRPASDLGYVGEFLDTFRARRIGQILQSSVSQGSYDVENARQMQMDRVSLPMLRLRDSLLSVEVTGLFEQSLLDDLASWDGSMDSDSTPAAVVAVTYSRLLDLVLRAKLGDSIDVLLGGVHIIPNLNIIAARSASLLIDLIDREPVDWFGPVGPTVSGPQVWAAAITRAFREAVEMLIDRFGNKKETWSWGRCHRLTFKHGLAEVPVLAKIFNVGPFAIGGDANTVFQAGPLDIDPFARVNAVPALRLIIELSSPPVAHFALAGGQSGHRKDSIAASLIDDWRAGRLRPLHTDRKILEDATAGLLRLIPKN